MCLVMANTRRIIKGVGVKGYGVILIRELNMAKFQTAITDHHRL